MQYSAVADTALTSPSYVRNDDKQQHHAFNLRTQGNGDLHASQQDPKCDKHECVTDQPQQTPHTGQAFTVPALAVTNMQLYSDALVDIASAVCCQVTAKACVYKIVLSQDYAVKQCASG